MTDATECGERLFSNTSPEGRETIRQQLRAVRQEWDSLFSDVLGTQRQVEAQLFHWTSFSESTGQLDQWLTSMEAQLAHHLPAAGSLEEKKAQLQSCKVKLFY